jgi:hypothetical protein
MLKQLVAVNRKMSNDLLRRFPAVFGEPPYREELRRRIDGSIHDLHPKAIIEIGGIDRPLISKCADYAYIGVDIESRDECYSIYDQFVVQSIEKPLGIKAEMVISITLLEHVPDNKSAIASIAEALTPGGVTHHYIPSKWHPYSVALRLVGSTIQKKLIPLLRPGAEAVTGYPAYFDYCSPSAMRKLFIDSGLEEVTTKVYYRANDYFAFFVPLYVLVSLFENMCRALKLEALGCGFVISGQKPNAGVADRSARSASDGERPRARPSAVTAGAGP